MQSIEEFMREFFRARTVDLREELERRAPFRERFFTPECAWDSREGAIERSESEEIVSILSSEAAAQVVTREEDPFPALRYHLEASGDAWIIRAVEVACLACAGKPGNAECIFCGGTGWRRGHSLPRGRAPKPAPSFRRKGPPPSRWRL
jgi:hypothetical protein